MAGFREAPEACQLGDLGFAGPRFTWCNQRTDDKYTKERFDRAVANPEWCSIFPIVSILVLAARSSNHSPLVVSFHENQLERQSYRRGLKFEAS